MRQWLALAWFLVVILAIVAVVSFVRRKQNDQHYRTTLAQYRSALKAGTTRAQVENYLREQGMPFERTCCKPGIFSDRTRVGKRAPKFFCSDDGIYVEFTFDNGSPPAEVASGSDVLKKISLAEHGFCL